MDSNGTFDESPQRGALGGRVCCLEGDRCMSLGVSPAVLLGWTCHCSEFGS